LRDALLADYRLQGRTTGIRVENVFEHFIRFCGGDLLARAVTPDLLSRYAAKRLESVARGTVHLEMSLLRRAWRLMGEHGRMKDIPAFPRVRPSEPRRGFFEEEEIHRVLLHISPWVRPVVSFLFFTGWRKSEALGLRWDQVDFQAGSLRIDTSKTGRGRVFPFAALPPLAELLQEQRIRCQLLERLFSRVVPWVFPSAEGERIRSFKTTWESACRKAGLSDRLVHDLRRTSVRNLERSGVPRSVAMQLTGHRTERVYNAYAIVSERDLAEGVVRLARHVGSARGGGRT
jgi:integrase